MSGLIHFFNLTTLQRYWNNEKPDSSSSDLSYREKSLLIEKTSTRLKRADKSRLPLRRRAKARLALHMVLVLLWGVPHDVWGHPLHDVASCSTEKHPMSIASMPLSRAVDKLVSRTGCPVLVDPVLTADRYSVAIEGVYTPRDALLSMFANPHVDVAVTISGLSVSPLDAEAFLKSGTGPSGYSPPRQMHPFHVPSDATSSQEAPGRQMPTSSWAPTMGTPS